MWRALLWGVLACCGHSTPGENVFLVPDANGPIHYTLFVTEGDSGRPARATPPKVFIDGVETSMLDVDYIDAQQLTTTAHHVELRTGTLVVAAKDTDLGELGTELSDCASSPGGRNINLVRDSMCEFDSGDLRNGLPELNGPNGGCVADFGCSPSCNVDGDSCGAGQRCTSRASSITPLFTHVACAPAGPQVLGDSCQLIDDPAGAYDNCGVGMLCVSGTCHATCHPSQGGCDTCAFVDGEPPELGACL